MTELSEEKDLKAFEESGDIEYSEDAVELEVEFEVVEPEEYPPEDLITSIDATVEEVIAGKWGKGQDRRRRLEEAGIDHVLVQKELVRRMNNR